MIKEKTFTPKQAPDHQLILDSTSNLIVAIDNEYNVIYSNQAFRKNFEIFVNEPFDDEKPLSEYTGLARFNDLNSNVAENLEMGFNGESSKCTVEYQVIGKKLIYSIEISPIIRNDEVAYLQISALDETLRYNYEELLKKHKEIANQSETPTVNIEEADQIKQERDEALELLIENAERLQMVFEGSNDGFWDWQIDKDEIFYSQHYYEILGYRKGELKADYKTWEDRIHPEDKDFVLETLHAHMEGKTDQFCCEYRAITKGGDWKWVLDKGKVSVKDENKNPIRIAGTLSDVDIRKKTEAELLESEARFVNMADNLPVMVWLSDRRINPTYVNKKAKDFLGDDFKGKTIKNYIHEDDLEFFKDNLKYAIQTKEVFSCEIRLKNQFEQYRWILINVVPRTSSDGEFIGLLGVGLDITERKEIETKLLESETQFTEITSVIGDGIFMIDSDWKLKFANPEFTNLLGYKSIDFEDENVHDIIHNCKINSNDECPILKVFETGETIRVPEDYFATKYGHLLPVSYVITPLKRNGNIIGCVVAFHDITERLKSESEMKRFVEELQFNKELMEENANEFARLNEMLGESETRLKELNASMDKFFSIISHDLRSPFTSIIGFAEVLLEDIDTLDKDEIQEFTGSIYKSSKNIQNLLENLLQWSRIQTGRIEFNPINFDLGNLVNDVVALYQVNAARKKIFLTNGMENQYNITADKFMIDTILRNLVSNSIKFTKSGGQIKILAELLTAESMLQISVEDTGVGMKEEVFSKLFKIDEHVTTKGTDKEKGTGLGLILCKEFTELHSGKIWAESVVGEGSKFKFTIPYGNTDH